MNSRTMLLFYIVRVSISSHWLGKISLKRNLKKEGFISVWRLQSLITVGMAWWLVLPFLLNLCPSQVFLYKPKGTQLFLTRKGQSEPSLPAEHDQTVVAPCQMPLRLQFKKKRRFYTCARADIYISHLQALDMWVNRRTPTHHEILF